ncbi:MAG: hypothetical protein K2X27_15560 [Candidatus Obscuribacterales bacterium]|nr:hypothetical protein [Candidatus Obscuribacterales bacterium]
MSSMKFIRSAILLSVAVTVAPCMAQSDNNSPAEEKLEQQVKADTQALTDEQKQLADYQQQAKWYEQFAQQRLKNATAERAEVEKRLQGLELNPSAKNPKSTIAQEVNSLKAWLADETSKRRQIESTRERWRTAIEGLQSKISQTKYQTDADKASLEHQKEIDKENASRQAENPKPAAPQIQQNTVLMPGWEEDQGTIPTLLGPQRQ